MMMNDVIHRCFGSNLRIALLGMFLVLASQSPALAQRDLAVVPTADPVLELEAMTPDPAANLNLFASDPDIRKPIQINFDSRGRLWVASSEVYPQIKPGEKADDKIIVLEDTDGDGVSDRSTVFADGLLIPTGVVPDGSGGCYVGASTELLHFTDTNGDGKADTKRVVMSGFGTEDTHHLLHTLRWGPDGCLYFNQSIYIHSHIETAYGTRHLEGGGIWRYRPETGELSVFCKGFINPWGHMIDGKGESFVTDGAYFEGINYTFPGAVFVSSPGETRFMKGMNPGSPKHCGLDILSGTHIPPSWAGDLVTSDFRGHRVCRFSLTPNQSTYLSRQQPEILTSKHIAFRPIDARMGPDGTLFVADWYNPIIQHGEVDFRDERRDRVHGRIWRVSFAGRPLDHWPDFESATRDQLIEMLESPALAVRQFAREHLWPMVRKDADDVLAAVQKWRDAAPDESTKASRALEQQWLGEVAGRFEVEAFELATSLPASEVRRTSLRSASRMAVKDDQRVLATALQMVASDEAPAVLEAIVTLGQMREVSAAKSLIETAQRLGAPSIADPVLDFALWQALRSTREQWTMALASGELDWRGLSDGLAFAVTSTSTPQAAGLLLDLLNEDSSANTLRDDARRRSFIRAIAATGDGAVLGRLLESLLDPSAASTPAGSAEGVMAIVQRSRTDRTVPANADAILTTRFKGVASSADDVELAKALVVAMGEWKAVSLVPTLLRMLDETTPVELKDAILKSLGAFDEPAAKGALLKWAKAGGPGAVVAIESISTKQPQQAAKIAAEMFGSIADDASAAQVLASLVANKATAKSLPSLIAESTLSADRARALLSSLRSSGGNAEIEAALRKAGRLDDAGWKLTAELSQKILSAAATHGDAKRGEAIYRRASLQCIQCHAIGPAGGLVGPNLISLGGSSQPDYILESLLEPDAKLKEGYNTLSILTDDGRITSGIPVGRDAQSIKLRLADGNEVSIAQDAIEDEQPGKSLMPAGLLDALTKQELIDLTKFLSSLGRVESFIVSTKPFVRVYETLVYTDEGNKRMNRTSIDIAATDDPALTWRPITTQVDASLPIDELDRLQPIRGSQAISYVRFEVVVGDGQQATLVMPTDDIHIWVDGRPTPVAEIAGRKFGPGTHRIVVGVIREEFKDDWSVLIN